MLPARVIGDRAFPTPHPSHLFSFEHGILQFQDLGYMKIYLWKRRRRIRNPRSSLDKTARYLAPLRPLQRRRLGHVSGSAPSPADRCSKRSDHITSAKQDHDVFVTFHSLRIHAHMALTRARPDGSDCDYNRGFYGALSEQRSEMRCGKGKW